MATVISAILVAVLSVSVLAIPEQGKWIFPLDEDHQFAAVSKHMYQDSKVLVSVSLTCGDPKPDTIEVSWLLRMSPCAMEFLSATDEINTADASNTVKIEKYLELPLMENNVLYDQIEWLNNHSSHHCSEQEFQIEGDPNPKIHRFANPKAKNSTDGQQTPAPDKTPASGPQSGADGPQNPSPAKQPLANDNPASGGSADQKSQDVPANQTPAPSVSEKEKEVEADGSTSRDKVASRKKRDESVQKTAPPTTATAPHQKPNKLDHPTVASTWVDGNYLFVVHLRPKPDGKKFKAQVTIRMFFGEDNYISAMDYPLLIFYGLMGLIYIGYGLVWLVLLACNWRDLLRVQFWIGGVILLGMLEKAVFFAEYENINKTGQSVRGAVIFAELVSCMKRTLARMLVIIVSLGFGIVKPRLGQTFHKVLFVGGLYFILASIEGCMRGLTPKADQSNQFLLAAVPLAVLEAIICWWIFSSLIQTTRTLRLRRNVVKLTLYRHFTNTLIFAVLASIACMVWSMTQHRFKQCIEDWKQLWVDEAFWHMLFVILLFIIMLLWRPTANNQRYAFSPLLDAADEEDDEDAMMNDAFDGMKMRGVKPFNGSPKQRDPASKVEDDLKWVEENIPSSVADKALPTLLDSDEELMTTKFEMSKME